jgi:hypothetical protein
MAKKITRDVKISDEELDLKKSKIRITTMIDYPVYEALKESAKARGIGYQTLLNNILKARFAPDETEMPTGPLDYDQMSQLQAFARRLVNRNVLKKASERQVLAKKKSTKKVAS